jgi:hypothetical protein
MKKILTVMREAARKVKISMEKFQALQQLLRRPQQRQFLLQQPMTSFHLFSLAFFSVPPHS